MLHHCWIFCPSIMTICGSGSGCGCGCSCGQTHMNLLSMQQQLPFLEFFFWFLWIWRCRDIYISSSLASKKRVLLTGERLRSKSSSSLIVSFNSCVLLASSNFNEAIVGQHTFEFCGKHSNFTRKSNIGFFFSQIFFRNELLLFHFLVND